MEKENTTFKDEKKKQSIAREELMQFITEKGFVYGPSPEIYDGGVSGFYDFGPLGKLLKNNIENQIRKMFSKFEFYEVECPIVMPRKVWEASGHLGGFSDPLTKCEKCNAIWRVDNLINEQHGVDAENMNIEEMTNYLKTKEVLCPSCKAKLKGEVKQHNLMLKTNVGIDTEMYNRPETATTTYLPFLNYVRFFRDKFPFGVFQIGNAYRNEISPRQHLIRGREFTQAEAQLFLFKDQKENFEKFKEIENVKLPFLTAKAQKDGSYEVKTVSLKDAIEHKILKNKAYAWTLGMTYQLFRELGFKHEQLRYNQHLPEKLAFYADDAWDLEVKFNSFGWIECCGCHDRTDYDLKTHSKFSGKELVARNPLTNEKETPHILEIAIGPNRLLLGLLDTFYEKQEIEGGKTKLKLPNNLSPLKAAIFPLIKKDHLKEKANEIYNELIKYFNVQIDEAGSIGKRYLRQDSIGTPYCITIDFDSLEEGNENFGKATIRDRNSELQERIPFNEIKQYLFERF